MPRVGKQTDMECTVQRIILAILLTLVASAGLADGAEESPQPIFVYAFTGNPDIDDVVDRPR